ncbi:hypothetical protein LEP1GSC127_4846 [Leptospira kirschneri str. 200801925]|nr:hypothetical protein LEP1GSC122_1177 [Leptospira kirschneri serovar Valbuzzi str. 200702274]EMO77025.1 hypothetical protein LEP1GSC127_4846 [Leptospira kirschneri str. 200801925]
MESEFCRSISKMWELLHANHDFTIKFCNMDVETLTIKL